MRFSGMVALLCFGPAIWAADAPMLAQIYDKSLASVEGEFVPLAEAMPDAVTTSRPRGANSRAYEPSASR